MSGESSGRVLIWVSRWALLFLLWLALADSRATPELVTAAVVATLGSVLAAAVLRPGRPRPVHSSLRLLTLGPRPLLRPPLRLVHETWVLARALPRAIAGRPPRGSFRMATYRPGDPRRSSAGRAATEIYGSLMANRYVVGIDDERGTILTHELIRSDEPLDPLVRR